MNVPLLSYLVNLIEELLKKDGPVVAQAATSAALAGAESDPKVRAVTVASVTLLAAAQNLKAAVNNHPDAPEIIPATK
jgi:hypothetical protein